MATTAHPNDYVHDMADKDAKNLNNRTDRTAVHARFTPLDDEGHVTGRAVEIADSRIRVTTRWTGDEDPARAVLLCATVDDRAQAAHLALHQRYQIETWTPVPDTDRWMWTVNPVVFVSRTTPAHTWVEMFGHAQLTRMSYETEQISGPPVWLQSPSADRS